MSKAKRKPVPVPSPEPVEGLSRGTFWFLAVLPLLGWWFYGLFDLDEGYYGAVVAEMNRRGEWITPFYNGKPWFEKPILLYWLAKPCLALFGTMFGARLPDALCTIGTYWVVWWFLKRRVGTLAAQLSVLILASTLLVVALGRMMMTDPPLLFCVTAALLLFWESLVGDRRWRIVTAGLLGLGVLAKGPVALILFVLIAGWTFYREKDLRPAFRGYWLAGTALLFAVVATWYVPAYLQNGHEFVQKFLVEQNLNRFTGGDQAHTLGGIQSLLLYIPLFLLGMAPWSVFLWKAWPRRSDVQTSDLPSSGRSLKTDDGNLGDARLNRYLATWFAVVFLFFTISGAKLPHYILPLFPPAAILIGSYAVRRSKNVERWLHGAVLMCVGMWILANGGFLYWYQVSGQSEAQGLARYVRSLGGKVAIYKMGRQEKDMGTGKLDLKETSLPSLLMYLDQDVIDTDELEDVYIRPETYWVITRVGRIKPDDFRAAQLANCDLEEVTTPFPEKNFKLYRVVPKPSKAPSFRPLTPTS